MRESQLLISRSPAAESTAPRGVLGESVTKIALLEVGPQLVREDELRVRELPEQEVRDAQLAARADQQVRVRQVGCEEVRGEDVLVDLLRLDPALDEPAGRLDELRAPAVVERDPQGE